MDIDFTKLNSFEIKPCVEIEDANGEKFTEVIVTDQTHLAHFWTVYGRDKDGLAEALVDCDDERSAKLVLQMIIALRYLKPLHKEFDYDCFGETIDAADALGYDSQAEEQKMIDAAEGEYYDDCSAADALEQGAIEHLQQWGFTVYDEDGNEM